MNLGRHQGRLTLHRTVILVLARFATRRYLERRADTISAFADSCVGLLPNRLGLVLGLVAVLGT